MVGALYTLYGLWSIQQIPQQKQKNVWRAIPIRISMKNFFNIEQQINCLADRGHADVKAIFVRMKDERAFQYTVFDVPYLLGHKWKNDDVEDRASGSVLDPELHEFVNHSSLLYQ